MKRFLPFVLLVILALIWGSSFKLIKEGLIALSPLQLAGLRIGIAGMVFWPIVFSHLRKLRKEDIKWAVLAGFLGSGIPAFLFAIAQTKVSSSAAGALNAMTPLFTLIIAAAFTGYQMTRPKVLGVLTGLIGALLIIFIRSDGNFEADFKFALLIVLATVCYGVNINLIKSKLISYKPLVIATVPLFAVSVAALIAFFGSGGTEVLTDLHGQNLRSVAAIVFLGILGTSIALILFNRLIQLTDALFSSSVTYLIPVVAMVIGWMDNEDISSYQIIGLALILLGIYLINRRKA